jgi:hypothetical protein
MKVWVIEEVVSTAYLHGTVTEVIAVVDSEEKATEWKNKGMWVEITECEVE